MFRIGAHKVFYIVYKFFSIITVTRSDKQNLTTVTVVGRKMVEFLVVQ